MKSKQLISIGAILLATLFWGMTFAFIKQAVTSLSPYNFLFWRFGLATCVLLLFSFKTIWREIKSSWQPGLLLGLFLTGTVLFQTIGLQTTLASTASFITGLSVILVPLFTSMVKRKWPSLNVNLAAGLALVGIGLISLQSNFSISRGELWILSCAVCFAIYILLAGKYGKKHHPLALTFIQCLMVCICSGILALFTQTLSIPLQVEAWTSILFCALFASIFAFILQLHYQKYIDATTTAIVFSCEPIFATLTAMVLLAEQPGVRFYIGAVLIFFAIILSEVKTIPQE